MAAGGPTEIGYISATKRPNPHHRVGCWRGSEVLLPAVHSHSAQRSAIYLQPKRKMTALLASFLAFACLPWLAVKWVASGLRHVRKMLVSRVTLRVRTVYVPYVKTTKNKGSIMDHGSSSIDRHYLCHLTKYLPGFQSEREMGTMGRGHANERQRK